jgi:ribonuclease VapC
MIIDTSAIMAILLDEAEKSDFIDGILDAPTRQISAGSWIELAAVLTRRTDDRTKALDQLVAEFDIVVKPVDVAQAQIGHQAYQRYGRGTAHKADLNFGDCFAYALAKATGEPLLFKGDDFAKTDITPAI